MKRFFFGLLLILLPPVLQAQAENFSIEYKGPSPIVVDSRSNLTVPFLVSNTSAWDLRLTPSLGLPEGWQSTSLAEPVSLSARESDIVLVHVFIPSSAPAGEYTLVYRLTGTGTVFRTAQFNVRVQPQKGLAVRLVSRPDYILEGETYRAEFLVSNTGNVPLVCDLSVVSGEHLAWKLLTDDAVSVDGKVTIPASGQVRVSVLVEAGKEVSKVFSHYLELKATDLEPGFGNKPVWARAVSYVEVVPVSGSNASIMHTLPAELGISAGAERSGDETGYGAGFTLTSTGSLDEYGAHRIVVDLTKKLDDGEDPVADPSDRYRVEYSSPFADVLLGDRNWTLSPLMDAYTFGRGAGAVFRLSSFRTGAQYFVDIFSGETRETGSGFLEYTHAAAGFPDGYNYRAELNLADSPGYGLTFGVEQVYAPLPSVRLDLDLSGTQGEDAGFSKAGWFDGSGTFGAMKFALKGIYADPGYVGAWSDLYRVDASAGGKLLDRRLSLQGRFSIDENNLRSDPLLSSARRSTTVQLGSGYIIPGPETNLQLAWVIRHSEDKFPEPAFDTVDNNLTLQARQGIGNLTLTARLLFMLSIDGVTSQEIGEIQGESGLGWKMSPRKSLDFSLFCDGSSDSLSGSSLRFGGNAGYRYGFASTELKAGLRNDWLIPVDDPLRTSVTLEGELLHEFRNRQKLSSSLTWTWTGSQADSDQNFGVQVKYAAPLSVPVSRKQSVALVRGRVTDGLTGAPVEGVMLRINGLAATTNRAGYYSFYLTREGVFFLTVDRTRLGEGMMPDITMPKRLDLKKGESQTIDFSIIPAARVQGSLDLYDLEKENRADAAGVPGKVSGIANALLELGNGHDIIRVFSGRNGEFTFSEVKPGTWTLRIVDARIPAYHYTESPETVLILAPGERKSIVLRVLPEVRNIVMVQDEMTLTLEEGESGLPAAGGKVSAPQR